MRVDKLVVSCLAAVVVAGCGSGPSESALEEGLAGGTKHATAMTRNLYLGADLIPATQATTPEEFYAAVTAIWRQVQRNDFRVRAVALADEIAASRPALVGLQEAYTWRTDTHWDGPVTPAEHVEFDYVSILVEELAARGLAYRTVASVELIDLEAPTLLGFDVRATDHSVILASDLVAETAPVVEKVYGDLLSFPTPFGPVDAKRGFVAVDAKVRGEWIRFVSTHLEAYDVPPPYPAGLFRILQATELATFLGADPRPTIVVGDLNSAPGEEGQAVLAAAGFQDLWATLHPNEPGLTDGLPEDLSQDGELDNRYDYILYRGLLDPVDVDIVGETAADKAVTGLWPSDHAGVVGTLRMLDPRFTE
jgi:hypothetical protein